MALKPFNSVDGFTVGETPINVVYANGDVSAANLTVTNKSNLGDLANVTIEGGSSTYVISTDGYGNLTWVPQTEGGTAGGSNTQVQYNDNNYLAGSSAFTFNSATGLLTVPNLTATGNITGNVFNNGNSNITITANGNINMAVRGVANTLRISNTGFYSNSDIFNIAARIEQLGGNPNAAPLTSNDGLDRGFILNYYDSYQKQAFIGWDESNAEFT